MEMNVTVCKYVWITIDIYVLITIVHFLFVGF